MNVAPYERKHYYRGDKAASYDARRIGAESSALSRFRWQQEMAVVDRRAARWPRGSLVLDAPCGTGRFFPVLAKHGHRVIGADISADMLRAIPNHHSGDHRVWMLRGDIECLPLPDSSVDVVLAMRVWSFLSDEARRALLFQSRRIARRSLLVQVRFRNDDDDIPPGAIVAASSRFDGEDRETIPTRQRALWPTAREFADMVRAADLRIRNYHPLDWGPTEDPVLIADLSN